MTTKTRLGFGLVIAALAALSACGGSSSNGGTSKDCADAGAVNGSCSTISDEIRANGGVAGTCTNPPPKFAKACASLQACLQCVGVDGGF